VAEFPTQYLAQHISRLGLYLGINIMIWGLILACHAACTTFAGLSIVRTLLGVFESWYVLLLALLYKHLLTPYSVAPILVLIIAMWYKKGEQGRRVSWFYVCNSLTLIFGGFVAYGVSFVNTKFASWRIFYIAIGALTMVIGALVAIYLPDSPVKAKRFTDAEKVAALLRVKDNQRHVNVYNEGTTLTLYKWYAKFSHQERPSLRDLQRPPRLADLPRHHAELDTQWRPFELFQYSLDDLRLHVQTSADLEYTQRRHRCCMRALGRIPVRQMARQIFSHADLHSPYNLRCGSHDWSRSQRHPKEQGRVASSIIPHWHIWCSLHALASLERLKYRRPFEESHRQCVDHGSLLRRQYSWHADFPGQASSRLYLGKDQHHRYLVYVMFRGRGDEGVERLVEQEKPESVGRYE